MRFHGDSIFRSHSVNMLSNRNNILIKILLNQVRYEETATNEIIKKSTHIP